MFVELLETAITTANVSSKISVVLYTEKLQPRSFEKFLLAHGSFDVE